MYVVVLEALGVTIIAERVTLKATGPEKEINQTQYALRTRKLTSPLIDSENGRVFPTNHKGLRIS